MSDTRIFYTSDIHGSEVCFMKFLNAAKFYEANVAPGLDPRLKPVVKGGGVGMVHVGSTTVRQLIEKCKPLLGLHGHIHESRGFVKIGRTLCINPGSEYGEDILRGALINLDQKGVKSHMMMQG
jgi:Icc-related predicted phosphoesterase